MSSNSFLEKALALSAEAKKLEPGVFNPKYQIAQGSIESDKGTSYGAKTRKNFFGYTAGGNPNKYWNGEKSKSTVSGLWFRVYRKDLDSFADHRELIQRKYSAAAAADTIEKFADLISESPYLSEKNGDDREQYHKNIISRYYSYFPNDQEQKAKNHPNIQRLHPSIRTEVKKIIEEIKNEGIPVFIPNDGSYRTFAEQDKLYAIGRTTELHRDTVTNAKAGQSGHNYGFDVDIVPVNGTWFAPYATYKKIGDIAKKHGFEWGGDWTNRKDYVHIQKRPLTISEMYHLHTTGKTDNKGYILLENSEMEEEPPPMGESSTPILPILLTFIGIAGIWIYNQK